MRSFRSRKQLCSEPDEEEDPLGALRRRCKAGAFAASTAYLAVLTTAVVRPTAMHDPVADGLLFGFGTTAALCTLGAVLAWAMPRLPAPPCKQRSEQQAEELKWAIRFGEDLADAFHATSAGASRGR